MSAADVKTMGRMLRQITDPHTRIVFEKIMQNIDTLKSSVVSLESAEEQNWIDLTLENGWAQLSSSDGVLPQYSKLSNSNIIYLRGIITGGTTTTGTVITKLPMGFRPLKIEAFPIASNGGSGNGRAIISPNGEVSIGNVTNNSDVTIHGYFFAEN